MIFILPLIKMITADQRQVIYFIVMTGIVFGLPKMKINAKKKLPS